MNKKLKKIITTTFLATMCIVMIGCNSKSNSNSATSSLNKEAVEGYPVEITTYNYSGDEVKTTYEKAPEKVLAVYQGSIETMLELGLEDRLVAAAGLDNELDDKYKKAFENVEYLTEFTPSKETVTALNPDMILSWGSIFAEDKLGDVNTWIDKGCNTYINTNTRRKEGEKRTIQNEMTDILNLGKIFNVEEKAQALVDEITSTVSEVSSKVSNEEKQSAMVIEFYDDEIYTYGSKTLAGDMVTKLGAELLNPEGGNIGAEDLIKLNPDCIFVSYMDRGNENVPVEEINKILENPAFASLSAVKNKRVYSIPLGDMYSSGIRTIDGINTFANGLYENEK